MPPVQVSQGAHQAASKCQEVAQEFKGHPSAWLPTPDPGLGEQDLGKEDQVLEYLAEAVLVQVVTMLLSLMSSMAHLLLEQWEPGVNVSKL